MYAGPRPKPLPSVLQGDDPIIEAELRSWAFGKAAHEDADLAAFEGLAEFAPIPCVDDRYEPCDTAYARMERDPREPDEVWL